MRYSSGLKEQRLRALEEVPYGLEQSDRHDGPAKTAAHLLNPQLGVLNPIVLTYIFDLHPYLVAS